MDYTGYKAGDLAFRLSSESEQHYHAYCYSLASDYQDLQDVQIQHFVAVEFNRGNIGLTSKIPPGSNDTYAYSDQDSYGQINLELRRCNDDEIGQDNVPSTLTFTPDLTDSCGDDGDYFVRNMKMEANILPDCKYSAYMFKDEAAQTAANLDYGMTLPILGDCKIEVVYKFKPKSGGGLDVSLDVYQHAFGGYEEEVRASMVIDTSDGQKIDFNVNKTLLYLGAGIATDEVDPSEMATVMTVSTLFVCENNNSKFSVPVTASDSAIEFNLDSTQAPESCGFLYWDPQMNPVTHEDGSTGTMQGSSASSLLKFSWLLMMSFSWILF